MADKEPSDASEAPSPGPARRARAPTITIDTSAVNTNPAEGPHENANGMSPTTTDGGATELRQTNSFDSKERPTSPHNVSSPTSKYGNGNQDFLSVPGAKRAGSFDSDAGSSAGSETYVGSQSPEEVKGGHATSAHEVLSDDDALKPDKGQEHTFEVQDNKFAFSPGQLSKLLNPKSMGAFHALGGLAGLEAGLRTDRKSGLSVDEQLLDGYVSFEDAKSAASSPRGGSNGKPANGDINKSGGTAGDKSFADRKRIYSDNRLPERKAKTIWQLAWMAYNDKVLILLTVAAVISLALGLYQTFGQSHENGEAPVEWVEGVAIMAAILIVVVVGALNDWQKERQFVKLNKKKDDRVIKVVRSGQIMEVSVHDIFTGDVVKLEPGDMVPVDGIFIEGHNVKADESSATGESDLLKKTPADDVYQAIEKGVDLKKMDCFIISGSKISEGVGSFLVTATGVHSSYGKTMMDMREEGEVTPLQSKLNVLAEYIAKLGGAAGLLLFVVLLIKFLAHLPKDDRSPAQKGQNFLNILIVAITIIVVAVPEGLPLAVTLALAFATTRMLKDNNLVRLLRSCEVMGNATTICSDKTGTLTQNKMTVVAGTLGANRVKFGGSKASKPGVGQTDGTTDDAEEAHEDAAAQNLAGEFVGKLSTDVKDLIEQSIVINSTAFEGEEDGKMTFVGSKTETALLEFAREHLGMGPVSVERSNANVVQFQPFDSGRKCMAVIVNIDSNKYRMYVKGASEIMLAKATKVIADPTQDVSDAPMTSKDRDALNRKITSFASQSLRTIGLLYRDFEQWPPKGAKMMEDDPKQADFDSIFQDMTFLGVVGIMDPLRPGVPDAVRDCQHAGVFVRMVTGDNVETARAIAQDCGILVPGGLVIEGPKFRKMSDRAQREAVPKLCVLARSSPQDKKTLVKLLKSLGETVAVTGDGTNDAPALKAADVGFSMGIAGTEVAKEASAIILMDDNFSSIVKALLWGRAVNDAVRKFLQFQITVNITAVLLTFISAVASSDESSVLTAVQLLWVNLIMDTFAALALATDPPTRTLLDRPPDPKSAPLISLRMWKMIIGQSIYQLTVTLILHFAGNSILSYDQEESVKLSSLVFNTFVWMQIFNEINNRRLDNRFNIFEGILHNWFFIGINCIMVGGQVMIIFVGGRAFSVERLDGAQWGISLILGAISIPVGAIIRMIPDEFIRRLIPEFLKSKPKPEVSIEDEENGALQWTKALDEIRDDLSFIRRMRGGRLTQIKYAVKHPREVILHRSRSASHVSSRQSLPRTPNNERTETANGETPSPAPPTPESRPRRSRGRSRSNSAFGAAAAMAGLVAGSVGGWSPIERREGDNDSLRFGRNPRQDIESTPGMELHPDTKPDDPIIVRDPMAHGVPPSQVNEMTPDFPTGPNKGYPDVKESEGDSPKEDSSGKDKDMKD
ncbi:plasma membrane calcium-transporting ATPase 3 [Aulographum hederae CBS 113979]|uniref:Calcium-transporting ATPase n=1 Tax=Aulographum hederae CBS 113979 TaxID=1176131 RepID=A0A6G1GW28_9PEZI|nr:plasma membrane calcium-transporting ATPase 3 [Aulographum hederae CBS 113979]